jgi:phage tail-like protein
MRKLVLVLVAGVLIGLLPGLATAVPSEVGQRGQGDAAIHYGLELDGLFVGWVDTVAGGNATADVVTEKMGPDQVARKHIGNVKYEEISLTFGTGMSTELSNWIKNSFDHKYSRKDGAVIAADYKYQEVARLAFTQARLSEVGFPALDAASKDAAKMSIKLAPEQTRRLPATGKQLPVPNRRDQNQWLPANFRLKIDGLAEATARVNRIDAIVIKQKLMPSPTGEVRQAEQEATSVEIPNLVIGWDGAVADNPLFQAGTQVKTNPIYDWHESFVLNGNNGSDKEKGGTLEYLDLDGKPLFTLTFAHLGIFRLAPDKAEAGSEGIRRVKAELYIEEIRFSYTQ